MKYLSAIGIIRKYAIPDPQIKSKKEYGTILRKKVFSWGLRPISINLNVSYSNSGKDTTLANKKDILKRRKIGSVENLRYILF
jgi:hypothetical protein